MIFVPLITSLFLALALGKLKPYDWENGSIPEEQCDDAQCDSSGASHPLLAGRHDDPFLGVPFESGYIKVGPKKTGQMFYWLFPTKEANESTPVILWLTGGPGCASTMAAVSENGPFTINEDNATMTLNPWGWTGLGSLIFVDQPLGTGFSIEGSKSNMVKDEDGVAEDLHEFLEGLVEKHPEMKGRPFFITGESYAGHYLPAIGSFLVERPIADLNFKGMAIGNGWVSPVLQYPADAEYAHENGMIGPTAFKLMKKAEAVCTKLIDKKLWHMASAQCNILLEAMLGNRNCYDIREPCSTPPMCYNTTGMDRFFNEPEVQRRLGVEKRWEECSSKVYELFLKDMLQDMRGHVSTVLNAGKQVLVYNGDQDFICNWRGGLAWTMDTEWQSSEEFTEAPFRMWDYNTEHRGELKTYKNLAFLRIYQAGHLVPMDQPISAFGMMEQFVAGKLAPPAENTTTAADYDVLYSLDAAAAVMVTA